MRAIALLCGVLFGAGLAISDMMNPARVLAFLDVAGAWDPSLAWVMAAALVPSALAYRLSRGMARPWLDDRFHLPASRTIDARLVGGALVFGVGWGLVGLCPGPAIAGLVTLDPRLIAFFAAMLAGMALHHFWQSRTA